MSVLVCVPNLLALRSYTSRRVPRSIFYDFLTPVRKHMISLR